MLITVLLIVFSGCSDTGNPSLESEESGQGEIIPDSVVGTVLESECLCTENMIVSIPEDWKGIYTAVMKEDVIVLYESSAYESWGGGWICSFMKFTDDLYLEFPAYDIITETKDAAYIVTYPTDVQFDPADKEATDRYLEMFNSVDKVIQGFRLIETIED